MLNARQEAIIKRLREHRESLLTCPNSWDHPDAGTYALVYDEHGHVVKAKRCHDCNAKIRMFEEYVIYDPITRTAQGGYCSRCGMKVDAVTRSLTHA